MSSLERISSVRKIDNKMPEKKKPRRTRNVHSVNKTNHLFGPTSKADLKNQSDCPIDQHVRKFWENFHVRVTKFRSWNALCEWYLEYICKMLIDFDRNWYVAYSEEPSALWGEKYNYNLPWTTSSQDLGVAEGVASVGRLSALRCVIPLLSIMLWPTPTIWSWAGGPSHHCTTLINTIQESSKNTVGAKCNLMNRT